ncbi:MAG: efflux RND transporter periplasmic adaptor subunit [Gammaproteobacteria bacterium]|nr:MAG: efflux RND transporter periplasmic adaptor subunit [Gammaproteobacteria bacterium]
MSARNLFLFLMLSVLAGCSGEAPPASKPGAPARPAQPIDVAEVLYVPYTPEFTFTTRLEAPKEVEVRPRVSGVIEAVTFREGSRVEKEQVLFRIDPRPFRAEVDRLEAQRAAAEVALAQAKTEAERAKDLKKRNAISAEQFEARQFLAAQRRAELAAVEAALETARLNLGYTEVKAPITGRASRAFITEGNTVQAGQTVLTRLVATDRLHAYIDVDERTWNRAFRNVTQDSGTPARLQLSDSTGNGYAGVIDFIDNQVNPQTGTLRVRAVFEAQDPALRPGAFARITLAASESRMTVMVPDRAVGTDLKNRFVLTVNEKNILEYRPVELGERVGRLRVILSGLKPGERIAVNGPARVGPGMPIAPREVKLDPGQMSQLTQRPADKPAA